MPPSVPIARKRGRPLKLHAVALFPSPALDKNLVDLAKAPNVLQQGGPPPTVPPTVKPGMQPTVMPAVINREVSDAVE